MEIVYFIGAFLLLVALIYGTLHTRYIAVGPRRRFPTRLYATATITTKPDWRPELAS